LLINFGDLAIIFCNESIREELNLEEIWTRVQTEEEIKEHEDKSFKMMENRLK